MNKENLLLEYNEIYPRYKRIVENTKEALEQFLNDMNIPFLIISTRVKDFNSFFEKISTKKYEKPFEENEDFCGIRIILYYLDDITKVIKLVSENYEIQGSENKSDILELNEFGYRSYHLIFKIKDSWCVTPNYKNLNNIKIELQIRTVLMHAWAEIEHKLGYKNKQQIPKLLQRKLFLMSAKLEDADSQFQEIKHKADEYKSTTINDSIKAGKFTAKELNLDTLQALLIYYFPEKKPDSVIESRLLHDIQSNKFSIQEIARIAEKTVSFVNLIEKEMLSENFNMKSTRANLLFYGLECFSKKYKPRVLQSKSRLSIIKKIKENCK
jgi:ppGpp synthetase/RelA/SpoT-type nucleotidyltranferase